MDTRPIPDLPVACPHAGVDTVQLCRHTGVPAAGVRGSVAVCPVHDRADCLVCSRCFVESIRAASRGARVTLAA